MIRVVIPADDPPLVARSHHLNRLRQHCDVAIWTDRPQSDAEKLSRLRDADVLLNSRGHVSFHQELLQQLPRLKMIAVCGIGYDAIDLQAATNAGVVVCNIPGRTATVVAEHAIALMYSVSRRTAFMTRQLRQGAWPGELGMSLAGKTLGVVGLGAIGSEVTRMARALGLRVIAWTFHPTGQRAEEQSVEFVELDELLNQSDVVSLHVRLSDQSRGLISARELGLMKPNAILINTARGPIVDTAALASALQCHKLFGAGIDVFDQEPIGADHPLCCCDHAVLTPHSADQTPEGIDLLTEGCVDNIMAFLQGRPTNVVNPEVL